NEVFDWRGLYPPGTGQQAIGVVIDDPFGIAEDLKLEPAARGGRIAPGAPEWVSPGQPKIGVFQSTRSDPLGWMYSHHRVDHAAYLAGREWQTLYERSSVGTVQAVDTTKEPVDGGRFPELITDNLSRAIRRLRSAAVALEASVPGDRARGLARV